MTAFLGAVVLAASTFATPSAPSVPVAPALCPSAPASVELAKTFDSSATVKSVCTEGTFKNVTAGLICGCEDGVTTPRELYKCIGGQWVLQASFCGAPICPIY